MLTGLGREQGARPMIDSHRLATALAADDPDVIIAPVRGGAAQACLMARACGEAFADTRIALVANEPSRSRFLASDAATADLERARRRCHGASMPVAGRRRHLSGRRGGSRSPGRVFAIACLS